MNDFNQITEQKQELKFRFYVGYGLGFITGAMLIGFIWIISKYI